MEGEVVRLLGAYHEDNHVYGDVLTIVYLMKVVGGELKAGDDALDAKFFPLDKLPDIHFQCFKDALCELGYSL